MTRSYRLGTPSTNTLEIETERLVLRPLMLADEEELARMYADVGVMRWISQGQPRPRHEVLDVLQRDAAHWSSRGYGVWKLQERDSGLFVGRCGFRYLEEFGEVELLYTLLSDFWKRGYGTEASRAALRFGFADIGLKRIIAFTLPENRASQRIMEKLGMRFERAALWRDLPHVWYALSREDYFASANLGQ